MTKFGRLRLAIIVIRLNFPAFAFGTKCQCLSFRFDRRPVGRTRPHHRHLNPRPRRFSRLASLSFQKERCRDQQIPHGTGTKHIFWHSAKYVMDQSRGLYSPALQVLSNKELHWLVTNENSNKLI